MPSQSPSFNPTNLELIYHKLSGEWPFGGPDITFFDDLTAAHKQLITGVINFELYMAKRVAAEEKFIRDQEGWFTRAINWNEIPIYGEDILRPVPGKKGDVFVDHFAMNINIMTAKGGTECQKKERYES